MLSLWLSMRLRQPTTRAKCYDTSQSTVQSDEVLDRFEDHYRICVDLLHITISLHQGHVYKWCLWHIQTQKTAAKLRLNQICCFQSTTLRHDQPFLQHCSSLSPKSRKTSRNKTNGYTQGVSGPISEENAVLSDTFRLCRPHSPFTWLQDVRASRGAVP